MASAFQDFSKTYEEFKIKFSQHPLHEEMRNRISRGRIPTEEWLRSRTKRMKDLMAPLWLRSSTDH